MSETKIFPTLEVELERGIQFPMCVKSLKIFRQEILLFHMKSRSDSPAEASFLEKEQPIQLKTYKAKFVLDIWHHVILAIQRVNNSELTRRYHVAPSAAFKLINDCLHNYHPVWYLQRDTCNDLYEIIEQRGKITLDEFSRVMDGRPIAVQEKLFKEKM